ncbi:MAG: electron transport complex subunit RsxA [Candidatus Marinimicrobia bacterium]|nr:electron transport complex subunit RsxA [Candidatus Neomarinimicrobiota bacterium]MBU4446017.1 electron transport complex subunit RsxA [bacterium]MCG2716477.1 electron transport complex subunit RsxA [Candidatus Neomarinimicrobiota bacterium]MCK4716202.1 electron transport complex subunit RsxA [Candidatus Neomarinimicrobiota bacterium]
MVNIFIIFLSAVIVNNYVLVNFLGICPFIGVSKKISPAVSMGMATTFVMTLTSAVSWLINKYILEGLNLQFLQTVSFILVIASLVQLVEMFVKKISKPLYDALGIFLPLITTNCAILGVALFLVLKEYNFIESIIFGFSAGVGFTLAIVIMAGIREELELADVPEYFKGAAITMIVAGCLALAFMGFSGLI